MDDRSRGRLLRQTNGVYIVQGEVNLLVTAMRRNSRWLSHNHQNDDDHEPLIRSFSQLKDILSNISDLDDVSPNEFLGPFLEVVRSEDTTGPITGLALTSVNKFISYGLIDPSCSDEAASTVENIADAVTHARFVGTEPGSDEVVLMKILHVLRTLLLSSAGELLTNESVCEIMQSCFRICFEMRLSELLRKSAEHTLVDMVQRLFTRLPLFKEDARWALNMRKLKMRTGGGGMDTTRSSKYRKKSAKPKSSPSGRKPTSSSHPHPPKHSTVTNSTIAAPQSETEIVATQSEKSESGEVETGQVAGVARPPSSLALGENVVSGSVVEGGGLQERVEGEREEGLDTPGGYTVEDANDLKAMATTPVTAGMTMVDLQRGFEKATTSEDDGADSALQAAAKENVFIWIDKSEGEMAGRSGASSEPSSLTITAEPYNLGAPVCRDSIRLDPSRGGTAGGGGGYSDGGEEERDAPSPHISSPHMSSDGIVGGGGSGGVGANWSTVLTPEQEEFVNPRGIRFTAHSREGATGPLVAHGLPCVRELLRFLVSLTNPADSHNTDVMIHMGLNLLTIALESGADCVANYSSLLALVRDELSKHLFFLLRSERLSLFAASIRVCFLLFESLRSHLKLQLEMYVTKLMDIIVTDSNRVTYEQREISLESLVQLLRIPGLVTELYLNYDCDLYCTSLFEDLTKLLSKNAFPVSGLYSTHLLSLDALLAVVDSIEQHCHYKLLNTSRSGGATGGSSGVGTVAGGAGSGTKSAISHDVAEAVTGPGAVGGPGVVAEKVENTSKTESKTSKAPAATHDTTKPTIRPNRMKVSENIPTDEQLAAVKHKKKLYQTGTDYFNNKPMKGITYLQEHGLLASPLDPVEVVNFIKENPKLDKKQIGEFVSNRKNKEILEAYQKSFSFEDTRVDEALRMYLESFRLPGEAPVIQYILEHFAEHWHKTNGEPFANADAAFTLAYAVIMLNVDQHNMNAKKQNVPMTCEEFKRNLTRVNGGDDFDQDMLEEMYNTIKADEIVMPAEQTGLLKENYLWKILQRRSATKEGEFIHAPNGRYDHDLFTIVWGPTVAALSFVFDKSSDETIIQKAISGFRKCAMISAHYGMSDVFDNLVISLCKFTTLLSSHETVEHIAIQFGNNSKAQVAARTVFGLVHRHADIVHEGWKNILDCMLQLYRAKLLAEVLVRVEDFVDPDGRISLIREAATVQHRTESGVLSSFYNYFTLADTPQQRGPSAEDQEAIERAHRCIQECHVEQLIMESKFLRVDSLQELLKALICASRCPDASLDSINGTQCDEDSAVLSLELLIKVVLQNRDRMAGYWQTIQDHLYNLIINTPSSSSSSPSPSSGGLSEGAGAGGHSFLVERAVSGLLRLAIRLLRREEIAPQVLGSLRMLLMMKPDAVHAVSKQISYGLHDLLKTNAANIHSAHDWFTLFTLLEVVGAGTNPPPVMQVRTGVDVTETIQDAGALSDNESGEGRSTGVASDRGYTSDSEIYERGGSSSRNTSVKPVEGDTLSHGSSWHMVYNEEVEASRRVNQYSIVLSEEIKYVCTKSLLKSCETLAFLVRDAAHVTPANFESCVHAIRMFVEASVDGGLPHQKQQQTSGGSGTSGPSHKKGPRKHDTRESSGSSKGESSRMRKSRSSPSHLFNKCDSDDESKETDSYQTLSIQLLDLMHTLHTRAATIYNSWAEEERLQRQQAAAAAATDADQQGSGVGEERGEKERRGSREPLPSPGGSQRHIDAGPSTLWVTCWCPLLQGIARLCCDTRRNVRSQALTYLQRALLVHDLQTLSAAEWECCFNKVLFPLLSKLLENINPRDTSGVEETRMRASTLLCKVFLQHLSPLLSLSTFTALWLTILEFMDKYMHVDGSDLLCEAIPESLKNMLLVMHTAGILHEGAPQERDESKLWKLTWDRIDSFLPTLRDEVFKPHHEPTEGRSLQAGGRDASPSPPPPVYTQQPQATTSGPPLTVEQSVEVSSRPSSPDIPAHSSPSTSSSPPPPRSVPQLAEPATAESVTASHSPRYVLHPPLPPSISPDTRGGLGPTPVPLLLNPDIVLGGAAIFPAPPASTVIQNDT